MFYAKWDMNTGAIMAKLRKQVKAKAEAKAQEFYDGVVFNSPVYTGQFRASWNISEGSPNFKTVDVGGSPSNPLPPPRQIAKATSDFPIFFISNGKPYAEILENGNHRQAPAAPVKITLAAMRRR